MAMVAVLLDDIQTGFQSGGGSQNEVGQGESFLINQPTISLAMAFFCPPPASCCQALTAVP